MRPCGKSGNRFILSVIDFASHFPLAYPLQSHSAYEVVKCLIRVFTRFEFPNELPPECGTEFMSELMQIFCLSIGCGIWNLALTIHNQMGVWSDFTARESLWSMVLVSRFLAIGRVSTMGTVRLQGSTGRRFDFCSVRFGFRSQHEGSTSVDNEIKAERWDIGFIFFLDLRERIKTSMEIVIGHTAKKKSKGCPSTHPSIISSIHLSYPPSTNSLTQSLIHPSPTDPAISIFTYIVLPFFLTFPFFSVTVETQPAPTLHKFKRDYTTSPRDLIALQLLVLLPLFPWQHIIGTVTTFEHGNTWKRGSSGRMEKEKERQTQGDGVVGWSRECHVSFPLYTSVLG